MEEIPPLCIDELDTVSQKNNEDFAHMGRTVEALRRKCATIYQKKVPSGDPYCPEEV